MPSPATTDQKNKLRSQRQSTKLFVACLQPQIVYRARLNGVPSSYDMVAEIDYDGASGTLADVESDMILLVGSTLDDWDMGFCRIRKAPTSSKFYIGELSDINWVDNCYLTVINDVDLMPKHIHIDDETPLMDFDVEYDDQHSDFNPVPVIGGHTVNQLVDSDVDVEVGSEPGYNSWAIDSTISSLTWETPDATAIDDDNAINPIVTYDVVGWHPRYCTVLAANGKSKKALRWDYIWDVDNPPAEVSEFDHSEDFDDGGGRVSITALYNASLQDIRDRTLCIVFAIDFFNDVEGSVGFIPGQENILFVGRLDGSEEIQYDFGKSEVTFNIVGYQEMFRRITDYPTGLEMKNSPEVWTDMPALSPKRALWHLLEWRSTATVVMDIVIDGGDLYASRLSSPLSNLWSQMEEIVFATMLMNIGIDAFGRFFAAVHSLLIPLADRSYPNIMDAKEFADKEVSLERFSQNEVSKVNLSGVAVNLGGTGNAFFSKSPGTIFTTVGNSRVVDRLLLENQIQANTLAGLIFESSNNPYTLKIKIPGNNRLITCFPNQCITFDVDEADTIRGIEVTGNWIPVNRKIVYDIEGGFMETELEFIFETGEGLSQTDIVPGSGDSSRPPSYPPFPPFPGVIIPLPGGSGVLSDGGPKKVLAHDLEGYGTTNVGMVFAENFNASKPDWYPVNSGLTALQRAQVNRFIVCPNGAVYVGYCGDAADADVFIARAPYIGGTFEIIEDRASLLDKYSPNTGHIKLVTFAFNPLLPESVAYVIYPFTVSDTIYDIYFGSGTTFSMVQTVTGVYDSTASLSYGLGFWVLSAGWGMKVLSADLTTTIVSDAIGPITLSVHNRVSTTGKIIHMVDDFDTIAITENNDPTSVVNGIGNNYHGLLRSIHDDSRMAIDPTGNLLMCMHSTTSKGKSSDGGSTLSDISALGISSPWVFDWAGGSGSTSRWIAGSAYMRYSDDFGISWVDKQGNLPFLNPIFRINAIKVIEK